MVALWRRWVAIEDEYSELERRAATLPAAHPDLPGVVVPLPGRSRKLRAIERRQDEVGAEIDDVTAQMRATEIASFADVAALLDVVLEYNGDPYVLADDRRELSHLIGGLERPAPEITMRITSTLERRAALGALERHRPAQFDA